MDLLYARWQMGLSLAFHIVFAVIGMAMPVMMVAAEMAWLRTRQPEYLDLARRWAKGTAILFAVGAVSGTVLSFELGLLWPRFMALAGPIIGMPFSLEGFAFFLEAIFLGLYLYGWEKLSPRMHVFAGVMVSLGGAFSGVFVVTANAWMNTPAGFRLIDGRIAEVNPFAAMFNPAAGAQVVHMLLAAYATVGVAVAGIHARLLLRDAANVFIDAPLSSHWASGCQRRFFNQWPEIGRDASSRAHSPRSSRRSRRSSTPKRMHRCESAAYRTWRRARLATRSRYPVA
jgi:cytochrome bd ubiquinol oxidase subunit I